MSDTRTEQASSSHATPLPPLSAQQFVLEIAEGPDKGTSWVSRGDHCTIGSHDSNDLVVRDRTVSRFHCEIHLDKGSARIRDLESRNGTVVDGVEVFEARLRDGSLVRLGDSVVRFGFAGTQTDLPLSDRDRFGSLVGRSVPMRAAFFLLERAAASDATVLIQGETGTGKDLAAESIHAESSRRGGPFVIIDCGSIPASLIESELFGHERGAFTGATVARAGAFESAAGGTVFLDEIGELPLDFQPKLLRVLEQRTVQRVGSNERLPVDVRIVAATNRDLRTAVNEGRFRSDLYFRLAVISVRMAPLRERREDIELLVETILESIGADRAAVETLVTPTFLSRIARAAWPGNVRELRNYLEQSLVLMQAPPLPEADEPVQADEFDPRIPYANARQVAAYAWERRYLRWLLDRHMGNVSQAARAIGMHRTNLHRLLKRHQI